MQLHFEGAIGLGQYEVERLFRVAYSPTVSQLQRQFTCYQETVELLKATRAFGQQQTLTPSKAEIRSSESTLQ